MRICVTGSRNYNNVKHVDHVLTILHRKFGIKRLAHGGANGVDRLADHWSRVNLKQEDICVYVADWITYGNSAGRVRNSTMLVTEKPDLLVAFPGNNGTQHCVSVARSVGIAVLDLRTVTRGEFAPLRNKNDSEV